MHDVYDISFCVIVAPILYAYSLCNLTIELQINIPMIINSP